MVGSSRRRLGESEPQLADARRWVAFRSVGGARYLLQVQSALEDLDGAVAAEQHEVAVLAARSAILDCLSIRSLACGGELQQSDGAVSFDWLQDIPADEVTKGLGLIQEGLAATNRRAALRWATRVQAFATETERLMGYDEPLPVLRSPEGMYPAIRLARLWGGLAEEMRLPPLVPASWIGYSR